MPHPVPSTIRQESPADALQSAADSLIAAPGADTMAAAGDTASAAATDSTDVLTQLSRDVGEAGRLLITGEWDLFWRQLYGGLADLVIEFVPRVLVALLVFILFYGLYRGLYSVLSGFLDRSKKVDAGLENLLLKSFRVVGLIFVTLMVLAQLNVDIAALLAAISIAGIAVGFAARDTLENFISGITILMDRPFRIGDNIEVQDVYGTVEEITLRSTRIRTLNHEYMVLPNIMMISQKLINHTILGIVRVEIPFSIAYKEYPQQARDVVMKVTEGDGRLHPDYKSEVAVTELGDSSVNMVLRLFLMNPKLEVPIKFEYVEKIREALREADIEIPFPHLQLFVDEAKALEDSFLLQKNYPEGGRPRA